MRCHFDTSATPAQRRAREILSFPHSPHFDVHFLTVTMAQILRPRCSRSRWTLGHSDLIETYHTPLLSKIWDLGDNFLVEDSFKDYQWWHEVNSPTNVPIWKERHDKKSFNRCLSSQIGMFENEVTWPELEEPCITNLTLSAPLKALKALDCVFDSF